MSNKFIATIEPKDIMNSKAGIISAYEMCAGDIDLKSAIISPNYGEFKTFIPTLLFIAENDVNRPDAELFCEMLTKNNIPLQVEYGKGLPHIYPLLTISEGRTALKKIIEYLLWNRK